MQLLETIKIEDGEIKNLYWHNKRCNSSRFKLFNEKKELKLEKHINPPKKGLYRCRILYAKDIELIEYIPYTYRTIDSLKVIQSDIEYSHKYANREELDRLRGDYNEVIIEKDGLITDTTIANIAFYNGLNWITPKKPLLKGTMRENLLHKNLLTLKDIRKEELVNFSHFALMNAMIGFQIKKNINGRIEC